VTRQGPSKKLEAIVALATPPARREEVLGDLYERYASPSQYVMDATRTVPLVIASQIRRTTDPQVLLLEALALYFSFFTGDAHTAAAAFVHPQTGILRIAIPVIAALFGLRLVDAYVTGRSPQQASLRAAIAVGFAYLSEAVISVAQPSLSMSGWAMFRDSGFALALLCLLQTAFAAHGTGLMVAAAGKSGPRVDESARSKHAASETRTRRAGLLEYSAALFVLLGFGGLFTESQNRDVRLGAALFLFVGLARVLGKLRAGSRTKPMN
jgi:hypothetical protein